MPILIVLEVILAIMALVSCLKTPADELPNRIPRPLCLLLIIILPIIGPLAWFVITWANRAEKNSTDGTVNLPRNPMEIFRSPARQPKKPAEPVPPDDNPDFLWSLEAQMRRKRMAEEAAEEAARKDAARKEKERQAQADFEGEDTPPTTAAGSPETGSSGSANAQGIYEPHDFEEDEEGGLYGSFHRPASTNSWGKTVKTTHAQGETAAHPEKQDKTENSEAKANGPAEKKRQGESDNGDSDNVEKGKADQEKPEA